MAKGTLNKVMIIGNLGKDPEMRYMPNGEAVATLTLATSESWKDKTTGAAQEKTEWHRVVLFRRLAEIAGEYLKKGAKVYIEGRLQTRKWQDKQGIDRYTTEIVGNEMQMLSGGTGKPNAQNEQTPQQGKPENEGERDYDSGYQGEAVFDDDIPY